MSDTDIPNLAKRLRAVEDELAIRNLAARFTDAVHQRDADTFRQLWADGATWEIGPPLAVKAIGVDAFLRMLVDLFRPKTLFFQLTHSEVVTFTGEDTATARFAERERGKGEKDFCENLAVYHDEYVQGLDGWLFRSRNTASATRPPSRGRRPAHYAPGILSSFASMKCRDRPFLWAARRITLIPETGRSDTHSSESPLLLPMQ